MSTTLTDPGDVKLTTAQWATLAQYKDTNDGRFMQSLPGASKLWRPLGLLDWHGEQYWTSFYSITDAGRRALATKDRDHE